MRARWRRGRRWGDDQYDLRAGACHRTRLTTLATAPTGGSWPDKITLVDLDSLAWLLTDEGQSVLTAAEARDESDPQRARDRLSRKAPGTSAAHLAAALTLAGLREHAVAKLGEQARRMYFTREALEHCTRWAVAEHRAARLRAADAGTAIDLGCGLGGDLVAMARAGLVVAGVDRDPLRVALSEANLRALDLPGAVGVADATEVDVSPFDVAFADPARRTPRGRTFDLEDWAPPWSLVQHLLTGDACVKAAPGIPHDAVPPGVEAEWISDHGEVQEAALWGGRLATTSRRATVIGDGGLATITDEDDPGGGAVVPLGGYLYEPDGAVIRAGLVAAVAAGVGGGLVDPHVAYVTSAASYRTPFARGYQVLEELPYRERGLRTALRDRGVGRLTIKKRGVDVVPDQLRRRLDLHGDDDATIVLTRVAGEGTCLLVRPF